MRFADSTALFHHHFIKLGFLDAWTKIVPGREVETLSMLRCHLDQVVQAAGERRRTIPMAYVEAAAD
jgi:hypothetical protein